VVGEATEQQIVTVLGGIVDLLCMSVREFEKLIEKPTFVEDDKPIRRFRFEHPNALIFQVLMCARVASALRAALLLLRESHTTEMGVLFRTIDDFLADVNFVDEIIEKGPENVTVSQREFLDLYFVDDKRSSEEMLENRKKVNHNERRQKVQASEARVFGGENPYRVKQIAQTIDDAFSGVVHGNYTSVMEMYGGGAAYFHTQGIPARFSEYRRFLGLQIHHALDMFFKVAYNLGHRQLAEHIIETRRQFEQSPAYTTH
jgi:hypothetical protein